MPAFTFRPPDVPRSRPGVPIGVFRYKEGTAGGYQPLPAVKCTEITIREGPHPTKALFEYISSNYSLDTQNISFERYLPLRRLGNPGVVDVDDRIVVVGLTPDGRKRFLFDGFAQVPETNFTPKQQAATFQAQGSECRLWDDVLAYSVMRNADHPEDIDKNIWTGNPIRFNPKYRGIMVGNQVADGWEATNGVGRKFAVFYDAMMHDKTVTITDPDTGEDVEKPAAQSWNLFTAVNYMLSEANWDEEYVRNPDLDFLKLLLNFAKPKKGDYFDKDDPSTYDTKPIVIPDTDVTLDAMPDAVARMLAANGFAMAFRIAQQGGNPTTILDVFRTSEGGFNRYKDFYLQDWNSVLDPGASNISHARLAADISNVVNVVSVDTDVVSIEAGFILAPLFDYDFTDWNASGSDPSNDYMRVSPSYFDDPDRFRLFGLDETGDGHSSLTFGNSGAALVLQSKEFRHDLPDMTTLFGTDDEGAPRHVIRRRPPDNSLWTKDPLNQSISSQLYISTDYKGPNPAIWDGSSGTWQRVLSGFKLCEDRLGIRVVAEKPNGWPIGLRPPGTGDTSISGGVVRIVEWLSHEDITQRKAFTLMLVCRIESDQHLNVTATRRRVSPTRFNINRGIDLRSKLRPGIIHQSSYHHPNKGSKSAKPLIVGNELEEAQDYAGAKRESRQLAVMSGAFQVPRLVNSYVVGDRIRKVVGREASLQTNRDGNGREAPTYPRVIGITWGFAQGQSTQILLSDKRSDYAKY